MRIFRLLFLAIAASIAVAGSSNAAQAAAKKPNIVFILADDMGYTGVGCYGSQYYETPNIDKLAKDGIRFTSGYTCGPNCQPTRAALMSGQYGPRTGIYTVGGIDRFDWETRPLRPVDNVTQLSLDKITIAQSLKKAGYSTAMFGKWHVGHDEAHHPSKMGFDEAIVSQGVHFDFKTDPKVDYPKGTCLEDFLTDKGADFIRRHKDGPFFLYLPHYAVHQPVQAKEEKIAHFKDKKPVGGQKNPGYAGMTSSVDDSVGRIVATLKDLNLLENTLIIFSSDNGGVGGYVREGIKAGEVTDNTPLRGGKGMLYEGGVRVPYIFSWKGKIPAGAETDTAINSVDLYPTLLAVAGADKPANYTLDGLSYLDVLTTGGKAKLQRDAMYWHFPGYLGGAPGNWRTTPAGAIRSGDYKLIEFFEDGRRELYNLREDLSQKHNLASEQPEKAAELYKKLVAWRTEIHAPMPTPNKEIAKPGAIKKKKKKNADDE